MELSILDLTRGLASSSLAVLRARELEVEIEMTQPSIVIDSELLGDMMRTDGFGIVAEAFHDPTLEVELEVYDGSHAPEALGDAWFLASEDVVAATEAVWLPPSPAPRLGVPARLALIAALVVAACCLAIASV